MINLPVKGARASVRDKVQSSMSDRNSAGWNFTEFNRTCRWLGNVIVSQNQVKDYGRRLDSGSQVRLHAEKLVPSPTDWRDVFIYFLLVDRFDSNQQGLRLTLHLRRG
jgi:hypothetical protein